MLKQLEKHIKKKIVLDTWSSWVYIGVLESVAANCAVLSGVDAHDNTDTSTPKERYLFESKTIGIRSNRHLVYVNLDHVVSFSLFDDVKEF